MKPVLEQQHPLFHLAGDSGYPKSKLLVTPYSNNEAMQDESKRLFNLRHSGIRTECTEVIFGRLKKRWPFVKNIRCHLMRAIDAILSCAILHNLCVKWGQPMPEEDDDGPQPDFDPLRAVRVVYNPNDRQMVRVQGEIVRDNLRRNMPPPSASERRKINRFRL